MASAFLAYRCCRPSKSRGARTRPERKWYEATGTACTSESTASSSLGRPSTAGRTVAPSRVTGTRLQPCRTIQSLAAACRDRWLGFASPMARNGRSPCAGGRRSPCFGEIQVAASVVGTRLLGHQRMPGDRDPRWSQHPALAEAVRGVRGRRRLLDAHGRARHLRTARASGQAGIVATSPSAAPPEWAPDPLPW